MSALRHGIVLGFLGLQLGIPLSYYLGDRVYDERFAWRMFSPIRMVRCEVQLTERDGDVERQIVPRREIIEAWETWMKRGHVRVVRAFAAHECAQAAAEGRDVSIHGELVCRLPDGERDALLAPEEDLCRGI